MISSSAESRGVKPSTPSDYGLPISDALCDALARPEPPPAAALPAPGDHLTELS